MTDLQDIRDRLATIAEELADRALDVLREAVEHGATGRPDEERRLTRARAAVERAIGILDGGGAPDV
jgi:hypothetical protein